MEQYICEKHGVHYGACASCLKEKRLGQQEDYKEGLRQELTSLQAENERLITVLSFVQEAVTRAKAKCIHSCNCCGAVANIEQALKVE